MLCLYTYNRARSRPLALVFFPFPLSRSLPLVHSKGHAIAPNDAHRQ